MPNQAEIGAFIRDRRKALGLSQEALGRLVGVSKNSIWSWENGEHAISRANQQSLASALRVPRTSLVPEDADEASEPTAAHAAVVADYLDGPRGKGIKPWIAEQLLDGACFESLLRLGGELTWEDVENMRQLLERRAPVRALQLHTRT